MPGDKVVIAPDKFRGTASAPEVAEWISQYFLECGYSVMKFPMSDGGEGLLSVFDGVVRSAKVTSADGRSITSDYKLDGSQAIIESAAAIGLSLVGGPELNQPLTATTKGVGELIRDAVFAGAKRIIVGCGGSATTDGGMGAIEALEPISRLAGVELIVAVDVQTRFSQAAVEFAGQKGASPSQIELLSRRLQALEKSYRTRFGVDISKIPGAGAAGGLAGGLAAIGGKIVSGFELVSEVNGLHEALDEASLVITGEGYLDDQSFNGKVVGGVVTLCIDRSIPYLVITGDIDPDIYSRLPDRSRFYSLVSEAGYELAWNSTQIAISKVLRKVLGEPSGS